MSRSRSPLRATALTAASMVLAAGCATSRSASTPIASASSRAACERPMVLVQNLTREPIAFYKGGGRRQTFIAEVAPGGAYQQQAEPGAGYFARAGRGRRTQMLGENTDAGAAGMVRVEMQCANQ